MPLISKVHGREILDSRGNPTIEVDVILESGIIGRAAVPSGASKGEHEAVELRDGDTKRYMGKGVRKAISNINGLINQELIGVNVLSQSQIDNKLIALDGTNNKSNLGANATLGVSLACSQAGARYSELPLYRYIGGVNANTLPVPMANILNGGAHADNNVDMQEFMVMPVGADSIEEGLRMIAETFHNLKSILKGKGYNTGVGDEGGFAPDLRSNEEAIEVILEAIEKGGYRVEKDIVIALDAASSEFYDKAKNKYIFKKSDKRELHSTELTDLFEVWTKSYPIISIEDGMAEDDWEGWRELTNRLGGHIQLVGDDLFVTNTKRLSKGISLGICNSILIKVNQIGTLTETIEAVELAKRSNYTSIISHRSGETEDSIIADLAVGLNAGQIKTGSASRSDRVSKYNQLLRISEELGNIGKYEGKRAFYNLRLES